ncbi:response regulator transcription factor [Brachybacterium sp. YJGR34]|uniref:response regulator n=1 Tax=Brachybacterium sp. YJGR34 TaxID=2059911 RepID=UPI000E0A4D9D|nr:response regulator transcription factor [Brachybacterium sp. YJGR34]
MIRVYIVDDQDMIRTGIRTILAAAEGIEVVGDAPDGLAALAAIEDESPDVVLLDIRMPGIDGVEVTRRLRAREDAARLKIIILTTFELDQHVMDALQAGADGFLGKGVGPEELAQGIRDVVAGGGALSAVAARAVIAQVSTERARPVDAALAARFEALTPRELDVVRAVCTGRTNADIAAELHLSPHTVKTHVNRAMTKVEARDRAQLVALAFGAGIAD